MPPPPPPPRYRDAHTDPHADTRGHTRGAPTPRAPRGPRAYLLRKGSAEALGSTPLAPRCMSSGRGWLAGGRGAGRAPALAGAHTLGTRAGRHSRTGVWLVMEEGLCESNSFLGHCCHRGEHFNPLPKREGGDTRAEGARRESAARGAPSLVNSSRSSPQPAGPSSAGAGKERHCSAFKIASLTSLVSLEILEVSPSRERGF